MIDLTRPLCDLRHKTLLTATDSHTSGSSLNLLKYRQDQLTPVGSRPIQPLRQLLS
jgi:hypothetical protein